MAARLSETTAQTAPLNAAPVRLVASDLDGTLLRPDGTVSRRTAEAVRAARQAGIYVVPVTGRPPRSTWDIASEAGLGPLGVCANGAAVVDLAAMEVVELETIETSVAISLIRRLRRTYPDAVFACEQPLCLAYEPGFFEAERLWEDLTVEVRDILSALEAAAVKLIVRRPGCSARDLLAHLAGGRDSNAQVAEAADDRDQLGARLGGQRPQNDESGCAPEGALTGLLPPGPYPARAANPRPLLGGSPLSALGAAAGPYPAGELLSGFSVTSSGLDWVEIAARGISKAYGMSRVCELLGVDRSEVLAVGDYYNDLPLLGWAARTAAPANALPEVLGTAQAVIPSNAEDGVAQLLESLVAGSPRWP